MSRLVLVGALCLGVPAAAAAQDGKRYAVVAGVNAYGHPKLPPLKYAVNDAAELADVLGKAGYAVTLLTDDTGKAAPDRAPTKANIEKALKAVLDGAKPGDVVVVALAGHGLQFDGQKDAFFCPSDARPSADRAADSLVSLGGVYKALDDSFAGVKILLVDACRDDPAAGRGSRGVDADTAPTPPKGVAALFSCSAGQRAFEHDTLKHGVFFHHVIEGLRGKARDADGEVAFNALADYVAKRVKVDVPKLYDGARQSPNQVGNFVGGSPVLLTVAAGSGSVPDLPRGPDPVPPPKKVEPKKLELQVGGTAEVGAGHPPGAVLQPTLDAAGNETIGLPLVQKGTRVVVLEFKGARCRVGWKDGNAERQGWFETKDLQAVEK